MQSKEINLGDIFSLETNKGTACFQCVEIPFDVKNEVELIKVFYKLFDQKLFDLDAVTQNDFFFTRFPLKAALRRKFVKKIGNMTLPEDFASPSFFRTENPFGKGWHIVNSKTLFRETVTELTEDQKKLSPWGIMNDTLIIERLEAGWRLENWK